jgi:hypothetical protein
LKKKGADANNLQQISTPSKEKGNITWIRILQENSEII